MGLAFRPRRRRARAVTGGRARQPSRTCNGFAPNQRRQAVEHAAHCSGASRRCRQAACRRDTGSPPPGRAGRHRLSPRMEFRHPVDGHAAEGELLSNLYNRIHWAKFYISKAGLIDSPSRGRFLASEVGKKASCAGALNDKCRDAENLSGILRFLQRPLRLRWFGRNSCDKGCSRFRGHSRGADRRCTRSPSLGAQSRPS